RGAEPVDRAVAADQRGRPTIADHRIVFDSRRHGASIPVSARPRIPAADSSPRRASRARARSGPPSTRRGGRAAELPSARQSRSGRFFPISLNRSAIRGAGGTLSSADAWELVRKPRLLLNSGAGGAELAG